MVIVIFIEHCRGIVWKRCRDCGKFTSERALYTFILNSHDGVSPLLRRHKIVRHHVCDDIRNQLTANDEILWERPLLLYQE